MKIIVQFGPEPSQLVWEAYDTDLSRRWISALTKAMTAGINDPERVYNFPNAPWSRQVIADQINACLDVIQTQHAVPGRAHPGMTQTEFNDLHRLFERVRGTREHATPEWHASTPVVQAAFQNYNVLIHRWEDFVRNEARPRKIMRFVASFLEKNYEYLREDDYAEFRVHREFGELALNYCQIGKPLWAAFIDGDDEIDEGIRPQHSLSADFTVGFTPINSSRGEEIRTNILDWMDRNRPRLEPFGLVRESPRLSIGALFVARLVSDPSEVEPALTGRTRIDAVRLEA